MRLDKVIADMGIGTRNEIRKACRALRITVNGETVKDPLSTASRSNIRNMSTSC